VLALTPIAVAISRHNNPDALLILCCVARCGSSCAASRTAHALAGPRGVAGRPRLRGEDGGRAAGRAGIVAAWLWVAPRGAGPRSAQLLAGGLAMVVVGGAWPLLMADAGGSTAVGLRHERQQHLVADLGYNGLGRLDGQAGGPAGWPAAVRAGGVFGGPTGWLRLLDSSMGGQAGG
jgi:4-amino-4-deoxy-L-arabinose transferase-like glycosyltransferase